MPETRRPLPLDDGKNPNLDCKYRDELCLELVGLSGGRGPRAFHTHVSAHSSATGGEMDHTLESRVRVQRTHGGMRLVTSIYPYFGVSWLR